MSATLEGSDRFLDDGFGNVWEKCEPYDHRAKAVADELDYVLALSRRHYEEIGFLPAPKLEEYLRRGQLWMAQENDELCGFMVWGRGWPILRVYQVCIQYDARRREHGLALVRRLIEKADREGYEAISCYVADDIDANAFWKACGFLLVGQRDGGARRGRRHNHWVLRMPKLIQAALFDQCALEIVRPGKVQCDRCQFDHEKPLSNVDG